MAKNSLFSISNIPSYLTEPEVYEYIKRFDVFFSAFPIYNSANLRYDDLSLYFSDKIIKKPNQVVDPLEEIIKRWNLSSETIEEIRKILDHARSREDEDIYVASPIAENIVGDIRRQSDNREDVNYDDILQEVKDIFSNAITIRYNSSLLILGCYIYTQNAIILYRKAIEIFAKEQGVNLKELYEETLAHELLHWAHYQYAENNSGYDLLRRHDYTSEVLKESLATIFEEKYCGYRHIVSDFNTIYRNSVVAYPYAGGKYIRSFNLFNDLFQESVYDSDKALRHLLDGNNQLFYDIKNLVTIKYRKPPRKIKKSSHVSPIINGPINDLRIEALLKTMGTGWFILKYAEDNNIPIGTSTDYGRKSSRRTRMSTYISSKKYHNDIIDYLLDNKLKGRVSAGNPLLKRPEIEKILNEINAFIE